MRIAILGAGSIARKMAETIVKMEEAELYAVASRDLNRAKEFASDYGITKAYGCYEEMLRDDNVELVYIATPHSHHYEHMKLCIENGKPVLCEKAFTVNSAQAAEIKQLAGERGVYVAEAIWTRYMPSRELINKMISSEVVGKISMVTANLSYDIDGKARIVDPMLAGGALLDVGVYGINFLLMHLGKDIEKIESSVSFNENGVDEMESITFFFKNRKMGVLSHGIYGRSDRKGIFYCERGYIVVENINNPRCINVYDSMDNMIKHIQVPEQITGYEYQIREAIKQIEAGKLESVSMPLDESIFVMEIMDSVRKQWNLKYPME